MKIKTPSKKRFIIPALVGAGLLLGVLGYGAYAYVSNTWPFQAASTQNSDNEGSKINLDPPTQEEIDASQDAKKRLEEEQNNKPPQQDTEKQSVNVGIAFADVRGSNLEIRAFTNGVIRGDGTCTAKVQKDSIVIERSTPAFIDVSSTQCEPIQIQPPN